MTKATEKPLESLKIFTHNVDRTVKVSQDGQLAHAIHETLHYALDGNAEDYQLPREAEQSDDAVAATATADTAAATSSHVNGNGAEGGEQVQPGFFPTNDPERPYISFAWDEEKALLTLPHPLTVQDPIVSDFCSSCNDEGKDVRDAYDVTVKFFYLGAEQEYPAQWVDDAMDCLAMATGLKTADTMILAFSSLNLDCPKASDEAIQAKAKRVADVWRRIAPTPTILSMGISDISRRSLAALLNQLDLPECNDALGQREVEKEQRSAQIAESMVAKGTKQSDKDATASPVRIPSSPSRASLKSSDRLDDDQNEILKVYGPGPCRRPRLCTINLREQRCDDNSLGGEVVNSTHSAHSTNCWDRGLADFCKEQKVLLVAHSDQKDILPKRTLPTLLNEFQGRIPHAMSDTKQLVPTWCLKYTVLIRDRGVLADKGFILYCTTKDA